MEKLNNLLVNSLELPSEILPDTPMLILKGKQNLSIENFQELLHFSAEKIALKTGQGNFIISGSHLQISYIYQSQIGLTGSIYAIVLEENNV